jgi:hypothetical protein
VEIENMRTIILAATLLAATLVTTPATAQTEDAAPATEDAAKAEFEVAPTVTAPDSEPATASESEAETAKSEPDSEDLRTDAKEIETLVRAGKYAMALGALLLLLVAVFRKWIFGRVDWFQTKKGGYAAAGGMALATMIGLTLTVGFSIDVIAAGIAAASIASGLHTAISDVKSSRAS